jgi:hypothetical protein
LEMGMEYGSERRERDLRVHLGILLVAEQLRLLLEPVLQHRLYAIYHMPYAIMP